MELKIENVRKNRNSAQVKVNTGRVTSRSRSIHPSFCGDSKTRNSTRCTTTHLYILVLQCLHIETNRGDRLHRFVTFILQPVENCSFSGIIKSQDQDSHLLRAEKTFKYFAKQDSHVESVCEFTKRLWTK